MSEIKKLSKFINFRYRRCLPHYQESSKTQCCEAIGDITTFSFHAIKNVTAGEGGAAMTNNLIFQKN